MSGTVFETYGGGFIDYAEPRAGDVSLRDVAHALSLTTRYGGHCRTFYSVAEHAILCAGLLRDLDFNPRLQLAALHHDSHEAYLGDIPTPEKRALGPSLDVLALAFDCAVGDAFGIDRRAFHSDPVKWADRQALAIEVRELKHSRGESPEWDLPPFVTTPDWWTYGRPMADVERDFVLLHHELKAWPV